MPPITVWSYREEYEQEKAEIHAAIEKVLQSGRLVLGASGEAFEKAFSAYSDTAYGVGVNSGTDALFLALKALGVGPGDEVITVSNTAVPTVCAIVSAGATPVFVDIDPGSYLMATGQLESVITSRTRCILPVHLYGQCVNMAEVNAVAERHGLAVLEDCAQCHGARQQGRRAGSMSDVSAFSFYPTKPLGTYGDGGMVCASREDLYEKLKKLRFYGMEGTYYATEHGYNSRLDEIHAEILLGKLAHLDDYIARRQALAAHYERLLADTSLVLPTVEPGNEHVFYIYVCRHPRRDEVIATLKEHEILVNISYPWPIHTMTGYAYLEGKEGDLPETERAAREIFSLPMYPALTDEQQQRVSDVLHDILPPLD